VTKPKLFYFLHVHVTFARGDFMREATWYGVKKKIAGAEILLYVTPDATKARRYQRVHDKSEMITVVIKEAAKASAS
jgi:hypothetical protein